MVKVEIVDGHNSYNCILFGTEGVYSYTLVQAHDCAEAMMGLGSRTSLLHDPSRYSIVLPQSSSLAVGAFFIAAPHHCLPSRSPLALSSAGPVAATFSCAGAPRRGHGASPPRPSPAARAPHSTRLTVAATSTSRPLVGGATTRR
jgi:hypothetical protein